MKLKDRLKPKTRTIEAVIDGLTESFTVREMTVAEYAKVLELYKDLKNEDGSTNISMLNPVQRFTLSCCLIDEDGSQLTEDEVSELDSKAATAIYTAIQQAGADNSETLAKK